jgi:hypothetical protein
MIYKFKSKATGDLILLGPSGDQLLRIVGREPARQGIFEAAAMAACIQALTAAVEADDARRSAARAASDGGAEAGDGAAADDTAGPRGVTLRQRAWPMIEMMRRAQAQDEPIVWGV